MYGSVFALTRGRLALARTAAANVATRIGWRAAVAGLLAGTLAVAAPARATLVNVAAAGNLLALLPGSDINASSVASFDPNPRQLVDNLVNTATTDDGLIFANSDTDQRVAVTGFDSSIGLLRLFLDPTDSGRFPSSVAIYYSAISTISINNTAPFYAGAEGGSLVSRLSLSPGLLTPVPGAHAGYLNIPVNAPSGTQTLLLDFGSANGEGDRISELQAFAVPEPNPATFIAIAMIAFLVLRRHRSSRRLAE